MFNRHVLLMSVILRKLFTRHTGREFTSRQLTCPFGFALNSCDSFSCGVRNSCHSMTSISLKLKNSNFLFYCERTNFILQRGSRIELVQVVSTVNLMMYTNSIDNWFNCYVSDLKGSASTHLDAPKVQVQLILPLSPVQSTFLAEHCSFPKQRLVPVIKLTWLNR